MKPYGVKSSVLHPFDEGFFDPVDCRDLGAPSRYGSARHGTRRNPCETGVKKTARRHWKKVARAEGKALCRG